MAKAAELSDQFDVVVFLEDALPIGEFVLGLPNSGPAASMTNNKATAGQPIVTVGNTAMLERLKLQLTTVAFELASVVYFRAIMSSSAVLGAGSAVMVGSILGAEDLLGMGAGQIVKCLELKCPCL